MTRYANENVSRANVYYLQTRICNITITVDAVRSPTRNSTKVVVTSDSLQLELICVRRERSLPSRTIRSSSSLLQVGHNVAWHICKGAARVVVKRVIIEMPVIDMRISRSYATLRAWEDGNNAEEAKNSAFRSCRRKISSATFNPL